jgi:hypothetical protein
MSDTTGGYYNSVCGCEFLTLMSESWQNECDKMFQDNDIIISIL